MPAFFTATGMSTVIIQSVNRLSELRQQGLLLLKFGFSCLICAVFSNYVSILRKENISRLRVRVCKTPFPDQ